MPFAVREDVIIENLTKEGLNDLIKIEADRYLNNVMDFNEIEFIFLKSVIYIEDCTNQIVQIIFGEKEYTFQKNIQKLKLLRNCDALNNSIKLLEDIKRARNSIAHNLEYRLEGDFESLKKLGIVHGMTLDQKKRAIAEYFKDVAHGFLYLKIGLTHAKEFIYFVSE